MYRNVSLGKGDCDENLEKKKHEQMIAPGCVFFGFSQVKPLAFRVSLSDTIHIYPLVLKHS